MPVSTPITTFALAVALAWSAPADAGNKGTALSAKTFAADRATVLFYVRWDRAWGCGRFENAQLQSLSFARMPLDAGGADAIAVEPKSTLFVDADWHPYAFVVAPGTYALTAFDLKVAASKTDVRHLAPTVENLVVDGVAQGGTFEAAAGEITYIGSFYVDCSTPDPIPWRYWFQHPDIDTFAAAFRADHPYTRGTPLRQRLFATTTIGEMDGVEDFVLDEAVSPATDGETGASTR